MSPLSPNKTVGGMVGAIIGAFLILTLLGTVSVGLLIAVALGGLFGDLLESMLKRQAGVKDAGGWLPGFGGLLDRIDSCSSSCPLPTSSDERTAMTDCVMMRRVTTRGLDVGTSPSS